MVSKVVESVYPCFITDQKPSTFHLLSAMLSEDFSFIGHSTCQINKIFFIPSWLWWMVSYFSCIDQYRDDPEVVSSIW